MKGRPRKTQGYSYLGAVLSLAEYEGCMSLKKINEMLSKEQDHELHQYVKTHRLSSSEVLRVKQARCETCIFIHNSNSAIGENGVGSCIDYCDDYIVESMMSKFEDDKAGVKPDGIARARKKALRKAKAKLK